MATIKLPKRKHKGVTHMATEPTITYYFEEIFPDYNSWKTFMQDNGVVDYGIAVDASFDSWCYKILMRHFTHQNIRYLEKEAFKGELLNVYENKFKQFQREKALIEAINALTLDDLAQLNEALTNNANNPNEDNPLNSDGVLPFISQQTFSKVTSNKLRSYLEALKNVPTLNIYKFFKAQSKDEMGFEDLFMQVLIPQKFYYEKGDN